MRNKRILKGAIIILLLALVAGTVFAQNTKSKSGVAYTSYQENGKWYTEFYNSNSYNVRVYYIPTGTNQRPNDIQIDAKEKIDMPGRYQVTKVERAD